MLPYFIAHPVYENIISNIKRENNFLNESDSLDKFPGQIVLIQIKRKLPRSMDPKMLGFQDTGC